VKGFKRTVLLERLDLFPVRMQSSKHLDLLCGPTRFDTQRSGGEILEDALD
jgi:hypothetical protein